MPIYTRISNGGKPLTMAQIDNNFEVLSGLTISTVSISDGTGIDVTGASQTLPNSPAFTVNLDLDALTTQLTDLTVASSDKVGIGDVSDGLTKYITIGDISDYTITQLGNVGYDWDLQVDNVLRDIITSGETVNFVGGTNVSLSYGASNNTITINSTNTTYTAGNGLTLSSTEFLIDYLGANNFITVATNLAGTNISTDDTIIYHDYSDNNVKKGLVSDLPFTNNAGTVTQVLDGNGMNFTAFTTSGTITLGTPSTLTSLTTNAVTSSSHTHAITTGISNANILKVDGTPNDDEYAKFTANGLEGRTYAEVLSDINAQPYSSKLQTLADNTTGGIVVYTPGATQDYQIANYGFFGEAWAIGRDHATYSIASFTDVVDTAISVFGDATGYGENLKFIEGDGISFAFNLTYDLLKISVDIDNIVSSIDHGSLSGLTDDDHTQYLLVDGTRAMTGNLDLGSNNITNVSTVDGVDISVLETNFNSHTGTTDAHHDEVTLVGSYDYITISGQQITRNQIDLSTDVTGQLPVDDRYVNVTGDGMSGSLLLPNGTNAAPALAFTGETNSGLYRVGTQDIRMAIGGANQMKWGSSKTYSWNTFVPAVGSTYDLGASGGEEWKNLYVDRVYFSGIGETTQLIESNYTGYLYLRANNVISLNIGGTTTYKVQTTKFIPQQTDVSLGDATYKWDSLYTSGLTATSSGVQAHERTIFDYDLRIYGNDITSYGTPTRLYLADANTFVVDPVNDGTDLFKFTSSGKFAIDATTPAKTIQANFNNTNAITDTLSGGGTGDGILINNVNNTVNSYANLDFRAGAADGRIAWVNNGGNDGKFVFITDPSSGVTDAMIIQNNGYVGVNTDPLYQFHVAGNIFGSSSIYAGSTSTYLTSGTANIGGGTGRVYTRYLSDSSSNDVITLLSGKMSLMTGASVNEISTSVTSGSTDDQLATAKAVYDEIQAAVAGENLWDRTGTLISTNTAGDDLEITGQIQGASSSNSITLGNNMDFSATTNFRFDNHLVVLDGATHYIYSSGNDKHINIRHDDTNGNIETSSGDLRLKPAGGHVYINTSSLENRLYIYENASGARYSTHGGSFSNWQSSAGVNGALISAINDSYIINQLAIGKTSADYDLDISGNTRVSNYLYVGNPSSDRIQMYTRTTNQMVIGSGSASLYFNSAFDGFHFENSDDAEVVAIEDDGYMRIGTGTTTTTARLHIVGDLGGNASFNDSGILIENTNATAGEAALMFKIGTSSNKWFTGINQSSTQLAWAYGVSFSDAETKLVLTHQGYLGIGLANTAPADIVTIQQGADSDGIRIQGYDDVNDYICKINIDASGDTYINATAGTGDPKLFLYSDSDMYFHATAGDMYWYSQGDYRMLLGNAYLRPYSDEGMKLGEASYNWSELHVKQIILDKSVQGSAGSPSIAFGDGDTGIYEAGDDSLFIATAGSNRFFFQGTVFGSNNAYGPAMLNELSGSTNPTIVPNRSDDNTGIGVGGTDHLSLIAGGVEIAQVRSNGMGVGTTSQSSYNLTIGSNGIYNTGQTVLANTTQATTDTDKFMVLDGNTVKYRTGAEVLSDLGVSGSGNYVETSGDTMTGDLILTSALLSYQENTDVDSAATETIATLDQSSYDAAFFDYVVKNGANLRAGTIFACHDGTTVEFTDFSTNDLGDTSGVTFEVDLSGGDIRLRATVSTNNWEIKAFVRGI